MKKLIYILLLLPMVAIAQTDSLNYVKTITYKTAHDTTPLSPTAADISVQVNYFDGLGRPVQSVTAKAGGNGEDIIQPVEYDRYGRQVKEYLPYTQVPSGSTAAPYRSNPIEDLLDFYDSTKYENTANPYSEKRFENSPLGRIWEQGAPGSSWKIDNTANDAELAELTGDDILSCSNPFSNGSTSGNLKISDNILILRLQTSHTLTSSCSFTTAGVSLGAVLPNLELGTITNADGTSTGYRAVIQGNMLYYFPIAGATPNVVRLDATLTADLNWYFGGGHTIKYDYQTNVSGEVRRFKVGFPITGNTDQTELLTTGFYAANQLYKNIVKDENWTPADGKNKTTEEFKDRQGRVVLKRLYNNSQPHDTYYVYDRYSNLSFVIPPLAADDIVVTTYNLSQAGSNFAWTKLALVDQELADDYDTELSAYENEEILNLDLLDKYGGQGGFTASVNAIGDVTLTLNITVSDSLKLRTGIIADLNSMGTIRDQELGKLQGAGYDYYFLMVNGKLEVSGSGIIPLSTLNVSFTGGTPLEYSKNYPWTRLAVTDAKLAKDYEDTIAGLDNSQILSTYTPNDYGAAGGISISIDDEDTVTVSLNITSDTPLELHTGKLFPLDIYRSIPNRVLGTASGEYNSLPYSYTLSIVDNNLHVSGSGQFGQLVLAATQLAAPTYDIDQTLLDGLCYIYHYDRRNRVVEKKVPGKGWEYMVYDRLDRIVATQDANLRSFATPRWFYTRYDIFGREVITGYYSNPNDRITLQDYLDGLVDPVLYLTRSTATNQNSQGLNINYNNVVLPSMGPVYTVNYYDDYNYDKAGIPVPVANHYADTLTVSTKGLLTGSKVRTLSTNFWETSIVGYDELGRAVWSHSRNGYLGSESISHSDLDFLGKPDDTRSIHKKTGLPDLTVSDHFVYDDNGRLLSQSQTVGGHDPQLIVHNKYDELGQLEGKKVGNTFNSAHDYAATTGIQTVDFTYNIRGWLKGINDTGADLSASTDLFAFGIKYTDGLVPLYNGNISETYWKSKSDNKQRSYNYEYDALNRLTSANYVGNYALVQYPAQTENYKEGPITYDKNGNIKTLERWGLKANSTVDKIDVLSYSYFPKSNQLRSVSDTADNAGFNNRSTGTNDDYSYDLNGNLKKDLNRPYGTIASHETSYNHLNLPTLVRYATNRHIAYVYDANGVKLEKKVTDGTGNITITHYDGGYVYQDGMLQFFPHGEGYVSVSPPSSNGTTSSYTNIKYIYQYKDHLGNIRLSYSKGIVGNIEIVEEDNYYAFGMKHAGYNNVVTSTNPGQKYKYNGKELQDELGLNMYDYGARNYDPAIGRWMNIDPLAENFYSQNPYMYVGNNPVFFVDPDGRDYGVYIDHDKQSIKIKSDYIVRSIDQDFMNKIEEYMEGLDDFVYSVGEGNSSVAYSISFEINVTVDDSEPELYRDTDYGSAGYDRAKKGRENNPSNEVNSLVRSFEYPGFQFSKKGGVTGGYNAVIKKGVDSMLNNGIHEIGHNFGMPHGYGLMYESSAKGKITKTSIAQSLGRVGLGENIDYGDNTGSSARASINGVQGTAPVNFNAGTVMTKSQFERKSNKKILNKK